MMRKLWVFLAILAIPACLPDDDDDPVDDWVGTWTVRETKGEFAPQTYTVNISRAQSLVDDKVVIRGLYAQGQDFWLSAEIDVMKMIIPVQEREGFIVAGSAQMDGSFESASISFSIDDGSGNDEVSGTMTKN
ncbi:MAG: hypothetical protein JJU02_12660 [Cryomorphaceae bacterium]|nr:hypothetical protein [Cryomorphaceae bacterium]